MFSIFKKNKPKLGELIPKNFIDIHTHILPNIDDGSKNINESLKIISILKKYGVNKIIGTPHTYPGLYDNTNKTIRDSFKLLQKKLDNEVKVNYASEYMIHQNLIKKAENNSLLTLKDNWILMEMSYISPPINLYEIIFELQTNNYQIIIAHPERYRFFFNKFQEFKKLKELGIKFQLNLFSCIGYYGADIAEFCDKLLKNQMIDFVGSDIHSQEQLKLFEKKIIIKNYDQPKKSMNSNILFFA